MQTAENEVHLCHWRWIPDLVGRYVWTQDPEFRRSKGGGGIVVARVAAYPKSTRRSGIRLILVKPQWRHGQYGFWINGKHMVKGKVRFGRHMTEGEIVGKTCIHVALEAMTVGGEEDVIPFNSLPNLRGEGILRRVGNDCRDLAGKRIEITAMWNGKPDGMTLEITRNAEKCPWHFVNGSNQTAEYRIVGHYRKKPFGDVRILLINPFDSTESWLEIVPDAPETEGRYELSVAERGHQLRTVRLTFEEVVRGIE